MTILSLGSARIAYWSLVPRGAEAAQTLEGMAETGMETEHLKNNSNGMVW